MLAHPAHYRLTGTRLRALLGDFRTAGGGALEVVSGNQDNAVTATLAQVAMDFDLYASAGSDFHAPGRPWAELGRFPSLPAGCRPVWSLWE
ncbi:MAG: hypothetical protein U5K76_04170 [Woeseiaceae bacterium]|nr:hypothetical protein [Woeseiaceae bacterium]